MQDNGWNPTECDLYFETRSIGKLASIDILTDHSIKEYKKTINIYPARVNWDSYKEIIANDFNTYTEKVENLSNTPLLKNLTEAVTSLSNSLYNAEAWAAYQEGNSVILAEYS